MTNAAKVLYGILLDRKCLSDSNGDAWRDEYGITYIIFTIEEIMNLMNLGNKKVNKMLIELEQHGLIYRRHQGLGKPNKMYYEDAKENAVFERCTDVITNMIIKYGSLLKRKWAVEEWLRNIHVGCFWKELAVKRYGRYVENMKKWKYNAKWMAIYNDFVAGYESGMTMIEIAKRNNVSERTIYRYKAYYDKMRNTKENVLE